MNFFDTIRAPDALTVYSEDGAQPLQPSNTQAGAEWAHGAISVHLPTAAASGQMRVLVNAPDVALCRLHLRWRCEVPADVRLLGDHWERGYGDLEWRGLVPERVMPWYFLALDGRVTHSMGVRTAPGAFCWWQVDADGISLWLDVRCGGRGVLLAGRTLQAATIVVRAGRQEQSPFEAARSFCRLLCERPLLPAQPVYGGNDWYYAYGNNSHESIRRDAGAIRELSPGGDNWPVMVADDGWQLCNRPSNGGPWRSGNSRFPDMAGLAQALLAEQVRPGLWFRPLLTSEKVPDSWLFGTSGRREHGEGRALDPSVPEVLEHIAADVRQMAAWGYQVIKHDFSTYDIFGRWGFDMGRELTGSGWHFADRSRTSAEITLALYRTLHEAARPAMLIGCNAVGHLAAGLVEMQRTGDDTSGREWERTRKMGINTLAFRMPQHETFFAADADCVGLTHQIPWELNRQWLQVLARSGTPLFVSASPDALGPEQRAALRDAFAQAAQPQPPGEPLDWLGNTCPSRWKLNAEAVAFRWSEVD